MASTKPPVKTKQTRNNLRCEFTDVELLAQGKTLAELSRQAGQLEEEKKRITDDYKARLSGVEADISIFANNIRTGYEFRNVDCTVRLHDPVSGKKRTVRNDTGDDVFIQDMNPDEMQEMLDFEKAQESENP